MSEWKSPGQVIASIVKVAAQGGNTLLNVGPRADGTLPEPTYDILRAAGDWLRRNAEFLPDSGRSPFHWNNTSTLTVKGSTVYAHLFHHAGGDYCLAEIANRALSARRLDGGEPVAFAQANGRLLLRDVPNDDPIATTVAIEVDGEPTPITATETFWIPD